MDHKELLSRSRSDDELTDGDHTKLVSLLRAWDELEATLLCTSVDTLIPSEVDTTMDDSDMRRLVLGESSVVDDLVLL